MVTDSITTYRPSLPGSTHTIPFAENLSLVYLFASIVDRLKNLIAPPATTSINKGSQAVKILMADDDMDDREFFLEVVTAINPVINVQTVQDGVQLMQLLKDENTPIPDMLFLDLNMPGKTGKQCLFEIKNNPRLKQLPVVIYSTSSLSKDIKDVHAIGANLYVSKPSSFSGAVHLIKKVFSIDLDNFHLPTGINNFVINK